MRDDEHMDYVELAQEVDDLMVRHGASYVLVFELDGELVVVERPFDGDRDLSCFRGGTGYSLRRAIRLHDDIRAHNRRS